MGVVLHRQPEVPLHLPSRELQHVLAAAEELDHGQGEIGESVRIGPAARDQEGLERAGARLGREMLPQAGGQGGDPVPPLGQTQHPAQRRDPVLLEELRGGDIGGVDYQTDRDVVAFAVQLAGVVGDEVLVLDDIGDGLVNRLQVRGSRCVVVGAAGTVRDGLEGYFFDFLAFFSAARASRLFFARQAMPLQRP